MGVCYIAHALTTEYYKIGITTNVDERLKGLRLSIPFFDIDMVKIHRHIKYKEIEKWLHAKYERHQIKNSEWFEISHDDMSTALMDTCVIVDAMRLKSPSLDLQNMYDTQQKEEPLLRPNPAAIESCPRFATVEDARNYHMAKLGTTTYGSLAAKLDVSKGALWKFVNTDYIPTDARLKARLGIPEPITVYVVRDDRGRFADRK